MQSEAYLRFLPDWLNSTKPPSDRNGEALSNLARALLKNHHDAWLYDFLRFPHPQAASDLLASAIDANNHGKPKDALASAAAAKKEFSRAGNRAGFLRSEFEAIYARRRILPTPRCQELFSPLDTEATGRTYPWPRIQILLELAACKTSEGDFDLGVRLANHAAEDALKANYPDLQLRAMGFQASLHNSEGRLGQSWHIDQIGLKRFWSDTFSEDRGYQFYSDLEFVAEQTRQWRLAVDLQREAIGQIDLGSRVNLQAAAHCRLARLYEMLNDPDSANEIRRSKEQFENLPVGADRDLYLADCEVAWAATDVQSGNIDSAVGRLRASEKAVGKTRNFILHMRYEKAWADLERRRGDETQEKKHLETLISIGTLGMNSLKSSSDRWDWHRFMESTWRRRLELQLQNPHDRERAFADWEAFRAMQLPDPFLGTDRPSLAPAYRSEPGALHQESILSFVIFPHWVTAWIADDHGVREHHISVDIENLQAMAKEFLALCSDPGSQIEKVNIAGSRLYQLLVDPLKQELDPKRTLFIEADQFLNTLPWAALMQPDGRYLGQSFVIANSPGLLYRRPPAGGKKIMNHALIAYPGAVEIGDERYLPLPDAEEAAAHVRRLYADHTYLDRQNVTPDNILKELAISSMFYFGGHAITREYNGELILQGPAGGGERFSASRLAKLNLAHLELAVLAACATAGESDPARDPSGLVRAFLAAGTWRVVASGWEVDSHETRNLIHDFYDALGNGALPEQALQDARNRAINRSESCHPYYWAAFQVFGPMN